MRVLKPAAADAGAEADAERRLVAEMLCLEHGARAVGPGLEQLPAPHEPWPVVKLRPITERGIPYVVHYRPTVGVVYYTAGPGFRIAEFIGRISAALDRAGDAHLRAYRAVAASPATVLRHKGRVSGGNAIVGPRKCFKKPIVEKADLPARLLQWTPPDDLEPPPHYSIRAAFTWVFMPVIAALSIGERGFDSMPAVNATVSAVFYDGGRASTLPDGGEASTITEAHFEVVGLPPFLQPPQQPPQPQQPQPRPDARHPLCPRGGVILVGHAGRLTFVGRGASLHQGVGRGAGLAGLAAEAWAPETILVRAPVLGPAEPGTKCAAFQCLGCAAPIGGDAVVIREPHAPLSNHHREWFYCPVGPGAPLLGAEHANLGLLLCPFCWNALDAQWCLTTHMGARVTRTVVPFSQAEVAAVCPGYEQLAPLLAGRAEPLGGVAGAFVVTTPADGPGAGVKLVLACGKLGRYPAITHPAIAAAKLGVVTEVPLAELRADHHR